MKTVTCCRSFAIAPVGLLLILMILGAPAPGLWAQVGIGTTTPDASAQLELQTTTRGFLPPRMTAAEMAAIASPAPGLVVYNTTTNRLYYRDGGTNTWLPIGTGTGADNLGNHTATANIQLNGNWLSNDGGNEGVYVTPIGNVGIGTAAPAAKMEVVGSLFLNVGFLGIGHQASMNDALLIRYGGAYNGIYIQNNDPITTAGTEMGYIRMGDSQSADAQAQISFARSATGGANDYPTSIYFKTTTDGSNAALDRLTIWHDGNIGIGTTTPAAQLHTTGSVRLSGLAVASASQLLYIDPATGEITRNTPTFQEWSKNGNAGTIDGTHFIGTTDNVPLNFRVNNAKAGRIENGAGANTYFGYESGLNSNNNAYNTAYGFQTLRANTSGTNNTATGAYALQVVTTGSYNTAIGESAMFSNQTGNYNTAVGRHALFNATLTWNNTAVGHQALAQSTTGGTNTALGSYTLSNNVAGSAGTAVGIRSQEYANNTATGFTNTNVSVGGFSLRGSATPAANTGLNNTVMGYEALRDNTTGSNNLALGYQAGLASTTGNGNTVLGSRATTTTDGLANATAIGYQAAVGASNSLVLGSINGVNGATADVNIGIGTTTPVAQLHTTGTVRLQGYAAAGTAALLRTDGTGDLGLVDFTGLNTDVLRGDGTFGPAPGDGWGTDVATASGFLTGDGTSGDPLRFINGTAIGDMPYWNGTAWLAGTNPNQWTHDGTNVWRTAGNVGIGVATPANARLAVGAPTNGVYAMMGHNQGATKGVSMGYSGFYSYVGFNFYFDGSGNQRSMAAGRGMALVYDASGGEILFRETLSAATAADQVMGGQTRLRILGNGNVGVGGSGTVPYRFHVGGFASPGIITQIGLENPSAPANGNGNQMVFASNRNGSIRTDVAAVGGLVSDITTGQGDVFLSAHNGTALTEMFRVRGNGTVGVGTAAPARRLHVAGGLRVDTLAGGGGGVQLVTTDNNGDLYRVATGGGVLVNDGAGNVFWGSVGGDDLGNHTATQNLDLSTFQLVGEGGTDGLYVNADGNIGIGTTVPGYKLEINHSTTATSGYEQGNRIYGALSNTAPSTMGYTPFEVFASADGTASLAGGSVYGIQSNAMSNNPSGVGTLAGAYHGAINSGGGGAITTAYGSLNVVEHNHASATMGTGIGAQGAVAVQNSGPATTAIGVLGKLQLSSTASVTSGYGLYASAPSIAGGGSIANHYGVYVEDLNIAGITTANAFYYDSPTAPFTVRANGNVGIGTPTPVAQLHTTGTVRHAGLGTTATLTGYQLAAVNTTTGQVERYTGTVGDNLGNHTATQNLDLAAFKLVGNGGTVGVAITATGNVGVGTTTDAKYTLHTVGTGAIHTTTSTNFGNPTAGATFTACSPNTFGQSFTATQTGEIVSIEVDFNAAQGPMTLTLDLYIGNTNGGAPAQTTNITLSSAVGPGYVTFPLSAAFPVINGQQYAFRLSTPSCFTSIWVNGSDVYAGGHRFFNGGASPGTDVRFRVNYLAAGVYVASNGNVGIGTSTPTQPFQATGGVSFSGLPAAGASQVVFIDPATGNLSRSAAPGGDNLGNHTATTNILLGTNWLSGDGGNEGISVDAAGNVGIGSATPVAQLHTTGTVRLAGLPTDATLDDGDDFVIRNSTGDLARYTGTLPGDNLGNHTATANLNMAGNEIRLFSAADANHTLRFVPPGGPAFAGDLVNGPALYGYGGGALGSKDGGTELIALRWTNQGNVGIGTATPGYALDIARTETATGANRAAQNISYTVNPSAASTANTAALWLNTTTAGTNPISTTVYGQRISATHAASASLGALYGNLTTAENISNSPPNILVGNRIQARHSNAGALSGATGVLGEVFNSAGGSISNADGLNTGIFNTGTGTISTASGLHVQNFSNPSGTITTANSILIDELTVGTTRRAILYNHATRPFVVMGNGNVGVGITNPTNVVDVATEARTGTHSSNQVFYVSGNLDNGLASQTVTAQFRHSNGTQGIGIGYNTIYATGTNADQEFNLAARGANGHLALHTNATERVRITGTGNMGVGVAAPVAQLHTSGTVRFAGLGTTATLTGYQLAAVNTTTGQVERYTGTLPGDNLGNHTATTTLNMGAFPINGGVGFGLRFDGTGNASIGAPAPGATVQFTAQRNTTGYAAAVVNADNNPGSHALLVNTVNTAASTYPLQVNSNGTTRLLVTGDGNVGIGTATPNASLHLNNIITNRRIILWEDANNDHQYYGYGINSNTLRYQVANPAAQHQFMAGNGAASSNSLMVIKGNGAVGINTTTPYGQFNVQGYGVGTQDLNIPDLGGCCGNGGAGAVFQTWTAGLTGVMTQMWINVAWGFNLNSVIRIYQGAGTGGAILYESSVNVWNSGFIHEIEGVVNVTSGQVYTLWFSNGQGLNFRNDNFYAGGSFSTGGANDLEMATWVNTSGSPEHYLAVKRTGYMGVGHLPGYRIDVRNDMPDYTGRFLNAYNSTAANGIIVWAGSNTAGGATMINFLRGNDATQIGSITQNTATSVAYNNTSDARLKHLLGTTEYGLEDLMAVRVYDYYYTADSAQRRMTGVVAQELAEIYPCAVTRPRNPDAPAAQDPWMVDYSSLTPLLIRSVQQQQAQIDELRASQPRPALSNTGIGQQLENRIAATETAQSAQAHEVRVLRSELETLRAEVAALRALMHPNTANR